MSRSPITGQTVLLQLLLARVWGYARLDLASDSAWQQVRFDQNDISQRTTRTVTANSAVSGIAASLIQHVTLRLEGSTYRG
ncbi:hypothetical protein GCM10020258_28210 [Sphingomonas yabuuchiae]